ncbi:hypothetical protein P7C73_g6876, partial [Tremellales sp. Uapishka_1]
MLPSGFEFTPATSPILPNMRAMSLFHGKSTTAPTSAATSPIHSRNPSRANSPEHGHSANSGKHGHGSHSARDAKLRSHPYGHSHQHLTNAGSTPNSPHFYSTKTRMSPPKLHQSLSAGSGGSVKPSVEEILSHSMIPPPPPPNDRTLPPPHTSSSFSSSVPSVSYSLSASQSQPNSPMGSRASSPVHSHSHSLTTPSNLAHSVRAAFGMTPIYANKNPTQNHSEGSSTTNTTNPSPKSYHSPPNRLAPMHGGNTGPGGKLPSFSRGSSPVHLDDRATVARQLLDGY